MLRKLIIALAIAIAVALLAVPFRSQPRRGWSSSPLPSRVTACTIPVA